MNFITVWGWTFRLNKAGIVIAADSCKAKIFEYRVQDWNSIGFSGGDVEEIRTHLVRLHAVFAAKAIGVPTSESQKKAMEDALEMQ